MPVSGTIAELEGILKTTYVGSVNQQMAESNAFLMKLEAYGMKVPVDGVTPIQIEVDPVTWAIQAEA